jgi:branched-chain amino acid transport system ATP-binding protein
MTILACTSLSKHFGGLRAVDKVSFSVENGEIFAIIGPNGAGKTTIFNLLTGFIAPTSGSAIYQDENLLGKKPHHIAQLGLTRTYQHTAVFPELTVFENARIGHHRNQTGGPLDAFLRTKRWAEDERAASEKACQELDFLGLIDEADNLARNLPYGKLRLLEIAIALCLLTRQDS